MQDNKERLDNVSEDVQNREQAASGVMENQTNLFDSEDVFTEAMVVEKEEIDVNSSPEQEKKTSNGDTAIFTFSKEKNQQNGEISHDELTVADIESSAKDYYNANHADDIQGKVQELCNLANSEFKDDAGVVEEAVAFNEQAEDFEEESKKKKKKKKKRGYVSNDDMELLSANEAEGKLVDTVKPPVNGAVEFEKESVEINSPAMQSNETEKQASRGGLQSFSEISDENSTERHLEDIENDEEKQLFQALGADNEDEESYLKKYEEMYDDDVEYEYTSNEQESSILMTLRKNAMGSLTSMFFTLVAALVCIYFEIAAVTSLPNPAFLEAGKFGVTYSMAMLQIMFICVMFNFDGLKRGFKGLRPSKASPEAFTAATVILCTVHAAASLLLVGNDPSLRSYCSVGCVSLFLLSVNSFFKAQTTLKAFCIAASKKPKLSCANLERTSDEAVVFENYLDEDSTIVTIEKSNFVEGFFKKTQRIPLACKHCFKRICVSVALALVIGVLAGLRYANVYSGIVAFTVVSLSSLPVNALIMTALPFFKVTSKISDTQTAFIGEAVCDAYDDTNVISFDDTEVFPARGVKVSSIKTYENNRIDKVILYMAKIFEVAKGPLSYVFANSVHDADALSGEAKIKGFFSGGIEASVDGKNILVGQADFMRLNDLAPVEDNIDDTFTSSMGSIMYMAIDGVLASKFYIKYSINYEFEKMLRSFYDAGVCVAIKTLDPCVTTELVAGFLKGSNYPLAVINKGSEGTRMTEISDKTDSTIISLSGVHNFLKGFVKADKLRNIYRTNSGFGLLSAVLGFLIASAAVLLFESSAIGVSFMVLYQLCWCLPTMIISAFSK